MITASISITNEVSSDGDDNIPSHWPTFEEVGGVRWDWDELSILSDNDDEDTIALPTSSRQRRTPCQQHISRQRRRQRKAARQSCIFFIIAIYNIIFYAKYFHLDHSSPHLELRLSCQSLLLLCQLIILSKDIYGQLDYIILELYTHRLIILMMVTIRRTMIQTI